MKNLNPSIIFFEEFSISPEVIKAQRMQELANIAEYRRLRLEEYKKWSAMTKEQREEYNAKMRGEENKARALVAKNAEDFAKWFDDKEIHPLVLGKEYEKPSPLPVKKKRWWEFWK
jgi:hypothetical protein